MSTTVEIYNNRPQCQSQGHGYITQPTAATFEVDLSLKAGLNTHTPLQKPESNQTPVVMEQRSLPPMSRVSCSESKYESVPALPTPGATAYPPHGENPQGGLVGSFHHQYTLSMRSITVEDDLLGLCRNGTQKGRVLMAVFWPWRDGWIARLMTGPWHWILQARLRSLSPTPRPRLWMRLISCTGRYFCQTLAIRFCRVLLGQQKSAGQFAQFGARHDHR